jgi:hypothetical protein
LGITPSTGAVHADAAAAPALDLEQRARRQAELERIRQRY